KPKASSFALSFPRHRCAWNTSSPGKAVSFRTHSARLAVGPSAGFLSTTTLAPRNPRPLDATERSNTPERRNHKNSDSRKTLIFNQRLFFSEQVRASGSFSSDYVFPPLASRLSPPSSPIPHPPSP